MPLTNDEARAMHTRRAEMRDKTREETESILSLSGLRPSAMWELANQYWPDSPEYDDARHPWWLARTSLGLIQIGRRKRVIAIDWRSTEVRAIVTEDQVTKEETMVHAYTTAKAVEYLTRLRQAAETCGAVVARDSERLRPSSQQTTERKRDE